MLAQMARYVPGKIGVPMVRIAAATRMGVHPHLVAVSVGIDVGTWMGLGAIISCVSLLYSDSGMASWLRIDRVWLAGALIAMILGLGLALVVDRSRLPRLVVRLLKAEEGQGPLISLQMVWMQLLSWLGWWILGLLMPMAVGGSLSASIGQAPVFVMAPIAGFLALVAPGGLGVREMVISYALASSLGATAALAAALLARGVAIASELLGWLLARWWEHRGQQDSAK
jgi:hypothetical protein